MKYWDSSALVPLLLQETLTSRSQQLANEDPEILTWWGTRIECRSALYRLVHGGRLPLAIAAQSEERLKGLSDRWLEIEPTEVVREVAERFLRVHQLRAADSLHLAAAMNGAHFRPAALPFVCYDSRLSAAATKEGFSVLS